MLEKDFEWLLHNRTKIAGFRRYIEQAESELPIHLGKVIDKAATEVVHGINPSFHVSKHKQGVDAGAYWFLPESANEKSGRGIWIELWMPRKHVEWMFEAEIEDHPSLGLYVRAKTRKRSSELGRIAEAALAQSPQFVHSIRDFEDDIYCVARWDKENLIDCLTSTHDLNTRLEEIISSFTTYARPGLEKLRTQKF